MVKVNIRRYEAPVTHRVLVELEAGVCGASARLQNEAKGTTKAIGDHEDNNNFSTDVSGAWDSEN